MYKILIAEQIPALNKGEEAILEGILESLKIIGESKFYMLSAYPEIDAPRYGSKIKIIDIKDVFVFKLFVKNKLIRFFLSAIVIFKHLLFLVAYRIFKLGALRFTRSDIWRVYIESDLIIQGHDGSFDYGGPIIFYQFFLPFFAKMLNKPIVLYAGKITSSRVFNKAIKFALKRFDLITLRETISYKNAEKLGFNENIYVTADLAFLLQPASQDRITEIMIKEGLDKLPRPFIGMTVRRKMADVKSLRSNGYEVNYNKHIEMLSKVIDNLVDQLKCTIIFIPHCIGPGKNLDDRIVSEDVFKVCRNKENIRVVIKEYNSSELKGLIGKLDLLIGERLHSVINAIAMNVPSLAISFSSDQRLEMIRMIAQEDYICYIENLDADTLLNRINNIWLDRDRIKSKLEVDVKIMKERAMLNGKLVKQLLER
ncbi:MAG: polysaccharide pyruvyl transferase family protein [Proteobacteria bacterium]|nr:polysaccharide pyruvyl transferase family protein [Pseudomonadota bacterium]